ncbi:MAG: hypothetical protein CMF62_01300 [Magnetococcales bacterium]|nr:hypothetical protein [Magnetococcales bacterium]MBA42630.1 hypothetical protein [Magnetococcales bacterium]
MSFIKYQSIEKKLKDEIVLNHKEWIATEKIHGTNFSFHILNDEIKCGKRSGFIDKKENFYNYQNILEKYRNKLFELFNLYNKKYKNLNMVIIYGEYFGGWYPAKDYNYSDTIKCEGKPIQKGVYYHYEKEFIAFDVTIEYDNLILELPFAEFKDTLPKFGFKVVPILVSGNYTDVMKIDLEVNSIIPDLYSLHLSPDKMNIIEGVVIRPLNFTSSETKLKIKSGKFSEVSNKNKPNIFGYINKNRFNAVKSKFKENESKEVLWNEFKNDVIKDYEKDTNKKVTFWKNIEATVQTKFDKFFY